MSKLHQVWQADIKPRIQRILETPQRTEQERMLAEYRPVVELFVGNVNDLVEMVETSNARATMLLRSFQIGLVSLAFIGTVLLMNLFSLMVVRPVNRLREIFSAWARRILVCVCSSINVMNSANWLRDSIRWPTSCRIFMPRWNSGWKKNPVVSR